MMARSPLRTAVIGCGAIAYEHLPFLARSTSALPVALCDQSPAMMAAAAAAFDLKVKLYADAEEMLLAERPDVVHVLTPPQTHSRLVRAALDTDAHVICEKPMTCSADETAALIEAARNAGKLLVESRNLLFNDSIIDLRARIQAGALGDVRECDILLSLDFLAGPLGDLNLDGPSTGLPGGAVQDFLPHLVYLFQALTGSETADSVMGEYSNRSGNRRAGFDFCDVLVRSGSTRGRLRVAADVEPSAFRIAVRGTLASIETDLYNPYIRLEGPPYVGKTYALGQIRGGFGLVKSGADNLRNKVRQHGTMHGMPRMLEAIYTAIREGDESPITAREMMATAQLADQIVALGQRP